MLSGSADAENAERSLIYYGENTNPDQKIRAVEMNFRAQFLIVECLSAFYDMQDGKSGILPAETAG